VIGGSRREWVEMVSLGGDRWEGLCTECVILYEGGWRRKWTWNTDAGETILEAWGKGTQRGVTVGGGDKEMS